MPDSFNASSVLGALALLCAGVIITMLRNLNGKSNTHGERLVRIETVLTGANGENGINGDMKTVKGRVDDHDQEIGVIFFALDKERRTGATDRRRA